MKTTPTLTVVAMALVLGKGTLEAQAEHRLSLAPLLGPTWFGHRYELVPQDPQGRSGEVTLGPTTGLELGLAVDAALWGRFSLAFTGSWASLDYLLEASSGSGPAPQSTAGHQQVVRLTGAVRYRIVPQAPGFFSAGLLLNRFDAGSPAYVGSADDRTELGGFGGIGLDIGRGSRHLRAEGRVMVVAPRAEPRESAPPLRTGTFEPRSAALDYSLTLAFVFRI